MRTIEQNWLEKNIFMSLSGCISETSGDRQKLHLDSLFRRPKYENIKKVVDQACNKLPVSVNATCVDFVNNYEPALVALLAQEIDPSQICPLVRACPGPQNRDVEIFMEANGDSKCPLCLLAVTKLENMVKSSKTKESIEKAIDTICLDLPNNMVPECEQFMKTYTDELIELIISDLKPDEVCVFLKLCQDNKPANPLPPYVFKQLSGNIGEYCTSI